MSRSPMVLCVCLYMQGEDLYLGVVLNTKETLPNFKENVLCLACWGTCPLCADRAPGLGRDILCVVGCILRMPARSPMDYVFVFSV